MIFKKSVTVILKIALFMLLAAAPATLLLTPVFHATSSGMVMGILIALLGVLPFVLAGLVMAAPVIFALRISNRSTLPYFLLLGAVVGALVGAFVSWAMSGSMAPTSMLIFGGMGAGFGLWGGGVWFFVFPQRNKSHAEAQAEA